MANTLKTNVNELKKEIVRLKKQINALKDYEDESMKAASDEEKQRLENEIENKLAILDDMYISLLSYIQWKTIKEQKIKADVDKENDYTARLVRTPNAKTIDGYYVKHPTYGKISVSVLAAGELKKLDVPSERRKSGIKEINASFRNDGANNTDKRAAKLTRQITKVQKKHDPIRFPEEKESDDER